MTGSGQSNRRTPGYHIVDAEALETAGVVRLTIKSGVVDFAILLDLKEAIDLRRAIAQAARSISEAAA